MLITGKDAGLRAAIAKAEGDSIKLAKVMEAQAKRVKEAWASLGMSMSLYVTAPILAGFAVASKAASEAEDAQAELAAALSRTGEASTATMNRLREYAESVMKTTIYDDEAIISGMAYAKNLGVQTSQLEETAKAAIGLAAKYRLDVNTAFMLLGRASQGATSMLGRYGIVLDQNMTKAQKFAAVLKLGTEAFSLAEARARTISGRFEQFKVALQECAEAFGAALLPIMNIFLGVIKPMVDWFSNLHPVIKAFILVIGGIAAAIGPAILAISALASAWQILSKSAVAAMVAQLVATQRWALVAAAVAAVTGAVLLVSKAMGDGYASMDKYLKELNKQAKGAVKSVGDVGAAAKKQSEASAHAGEEARKAADAVTLKYRDQAQSIWAIYEGLKSAREEDEKRQRAAIGWKSLGDIWKGAAEQGALHRFGPQSSYREKIGGRGAGQAVEPGAWNEAMAIWRRQEASQKRMDNFLAAIADTLRTGALA
jgi:hypothetical protein